jgi:uncharacterized protein (DUF433 family)
MSKTPRFVRSLEQARQNIRNYHVRVAEDHLLRQRIGYVRAWYTDLDADGTWLFAPSKWTGYQEPSRYLAESGNAGQRNGRETERALADWYQVVEPSERLHGELFAALKAFLASMDQAPNRLARINKPKGGFERHVAQNDWSARERGALLDRVTSNPAICGGRPIIRGTRMRVSDIVELMAYGATREEILEDYDYINADDIAAALLYAAQASDYRTIRAA